MNPAAPVTSRRIAASLVPAALLRLLSQVVDLLAVPLDFLRALEQVDDAVAAPELEPRVGEVVARVRLGERARAREAGDRLLEQRQRAVVVAGLHQLEAAVVEGARIVRRRSRGLGGLRLLR